MMTLRAPLISSRRRIMTTPPGKDTPLVVDGFLMPLATLTRASEAWDWGSDGLIYKVANNTPIIGYNPATLVRRGVAIRKAWTNSLLDNRDLSQSTWVKTIYAILDGQSGNYVSTPDAAILDVVNDLDLRVEITPDTWMPGTVTNLVSKYLTSGDQRSYTLQIRTDGKLRLFWSTDGTVGNLVTAISTIATGLNDGIKKWVRATLDVDNGASGYDVKFYTSDDGVNWSQLGSTVTGGSTTSIFAGTTVLEIGSINSGALQNFPGKIHRAQVYDGIDGTLVADFNPTLDADDTDTSFISSITDETWSLQGDADLLSAAPVKDQVGVDGVANTAHSLGVEDEVYQDLTITDDSNTHIEGILCEKNNGTAFLWVELLGGTAERSYGAIVDTSDGSKTAFGEAVSGDITVKNRGSFYQIDLAVPNNGTGNTTLRKHIRADAGTIVYDFGGVYLNSSYAGPHIETGASAVTREASGITNTSIDYFNVVTGSQVIRVHTSPGGGTQVLWQVDDGTENNRFRIIRNTSDEIHFVVTDGGVDQCDINAGTVADDTEFAIAVGWEADNFAASLDGATAETDPGGTMPTGMTTERQGSDTSGDHWDAWIDDNTHYPRRLANAQLKSLSG